MNVGRNDACPCGSGRKFKQCCLREVEQREVIPDLGIQTALGWLSRRFGDQFEDNLENNFFVEYSSSEISAAIADHGDGMAEMLAINIGDFLLSDAVYERGDEEGRGIDWVLDAGGPRLTRGQRDFLEALADAPLRLYEVVGVQPGQGLELRDAVDPERSPPFVTERTASQSLRVGNMLGTRVVRQGEQASLGGALFPLDRMAALQVMGRLDHMLDDDEVPDDVDGANRASPGDEARPEHGAVDSIRPATPDMAAFLEQLECDLDPDEEADAAAVYEEIENGFLADALRAAWLGSLLPGFLPELVDRATGMPLLLVEDDYDVEDPAALEAALAGQRDVTGNARDGWSRVQNSAGEHAPVRVLSAINPAEARDRITLFHTTASAAETGVEWFASVASAHVSHRTRRVTDPRDALGNPVAVVPLGRARRSAGPELTPEALGKVYEQAIRNTYVTWCDEPIPVLGGKTPRECLSHPADRERVRFLLRSYEYNEADQAAAAGRPVVSFDFLWQALALSRAEQAEGKRAD